MSQNKTIPDHAFILAAGFGRRLRPLTQDIPKPMIAVGGIPMIDQALDRLEAIDVRTCVVNTHYKAQMLQGHLQEREKPEIIIAHEPALLDTGGGIKHALSHFKSAFYVLSGDSVWEDAPNENALEMLAAHWDGEKMDILILLQPVETMTLTHGVGDYDLDEDGRAVRCPDQNGRYMFTSIRINARGIFETAPDGAFSYLDLLDKAQQKGRLYGLVHKGEWHHISTPEDLDAVNAALAHKRQSA